ncbi:unnamed protein product [Polarella glacialis]|uniref:FCP1 homology domain-containing protein n=1 Tax=Polarella glacialis TaxID=89957 RepID=A0A813HTJ4_POLGL|nr:unnamed protein product [Polarella glacialis]
MPCIAVGNDEDAEDSEEEEEEEEEKKEDVPKDAPPQMRVLFLDIDGVLNSRPDSRVIKVEGGPCALLRNLLQASGAVLVLSSPWRRHHDYILKVLGNFNVFPDGELPKVLQTTPFNADTARRDLEILQWLNAHRGQVEAWAAIDGGDLLRWPSAARLEGHVVRVAEGTGLRSEDVEAALQALGGARAPQPQCDLERGIPTALRSAAGAVSQQAASAPAGLSSALAWDQGLASKMEAMLSALAPGTSRGLLGGQTGLPALFDPPVRSEATTALHRSGEDEAVREAGAAEFDSVFSTAKQRFS